jgi:hypothetical protein
MEELMQKSVFLVRGYFSYLMGDHEANDAATNDSCIEFNFIHG